MSEEEFKAYAKANNIFTLNERLVDLDIYVDEYDDSIMIRCITINTHIVYRTVFNYFPEENDMKVITSKCLG